MKTFTEKDQKRGERLRQCIYKSGFNQASFAEEITRTSLYNINVSNLSSMIHGKRAISRNFAHYASKILGVSEKYLLCETDNISSGDNKTIFSITEENDTLITSVINVLEQNGIKVYFYTLSRFIEPKTTRLTDFIGYNASSKTIAKTLSQLEKTAIFPTDKHEINNLIKRIESEKEESLYLSFKDYSNIRKKSTLGALVGVSRDTANCLYKENGIQSESVIECIEINGQIILYPEFVSLVNISSKNITALFSSVPEQVNPNLDFKNCFNYSVLG